MKTAKVIAIMVVAVLWIVVVCPARNSNGHVSNSGSSDGSVQLAEGQDQWEPIWWTEPKNPTEKDVITFWGITRAISNDCYWEVHTNGVSIFVVDHDNKTVELRLEPGQSGLACPDIWQPVYKEVIGQFGPLPAGQWVLYSEDIYITFSTELHISIVAEVIYVDDDADGLNNGSSWKNAYRHLQDALAAAGSGDEIRVAQGTYKPDQGANQIPGDRKATFQLINGVTLKGGYGGITAADPNSRDFKVHQSILSGDFLGNDTPVISNPLGYLRDDSRLDNSYHVVTATGTNATVILEGFTITGGYDNRVELPNSKWGRGAGMLIDSCSPRIINCTFQGNASNAFGGGLSNLAGNPTLIGCSFFGNGAFDDGGAIENLNGQLTVVSCVFQGNNAPIRGGGGVVNWPAGNLTIQNSIFTGNRASYGGAISNKGACLILTNCTFAGNRALVGQALHSIVFAEQASVVKVANCIFWDGVNGICNDIGSIMELTHCDIHGGWLGEGEDNIDIYPYFINGGYWEDPCSTPIRYWDDIWVDGDYHLKSQAGRWNPETQSWVKDDVTSPCIDAGDPISPIRHEPFPNGGIINMGAYGGTAEASKSYFGEPVCETIIAGDINGDCKVDFIDFFLLSSHWLIDNSQ